MKGIKIIIILIVINLLLIGVIYNFIKKDYLKNEKIITKVMTETKNEYNINSLNKSHTDYAQYIENCKMQIATALTNEGIETNNDETLETMATSISKVLKVRTSNATATADNITAGATAWVDGQLIVGTGVDNDYYYNKGKEDSTVRILKAMYNSATISKTYSGLQVGYHYDYGKSGSDQKTYNSGNIPIIYQNDGKYYALNSISFAGSVYNHLNSSGSTGTGTLSYSIKLDDGTVIKNGSLSTSQSTTVSNTYTVSLFEHNIGDSENIQVSAVLSHKGNGGKSHDYSQTYGTLTLGTINVKYIELTN